MQGPQIIPTGVVGPPPPHMCALILGRAPTTLQGVQVFPGIIDDDYTGEIKILATAVNGVAAIPAGTKIAQLILLPLNSGNSPGNTASLGSSDVYWVQPISHKRPTLTLFIEGKKFQGILDTGADATVISQKYWPSEWPLTSSLTDLKGIGQSRNPLVSSRVLNWTDTKDNTGNKGTVTPFVVPDLPVNLWGRDILSQMKVILASPDSLVTHQMLRMGFIPGTGLGRLGQGQVEPVQPIQKTDKFGLGYVDF